MRIYSIDCIRPQNSFGGNKSSSILQNRPVQPMRDGLYTAGAWFGFGVVLDFLSRKCRFSKSPFKNSLAINGIIAGGAGIFTICRDIFCKEKSSGE